MPCFGTTQRTKSNAEQLALAYGTSLRCIDIKAAVEQHFADIGHDPDKLDVTFENAQARQRTYLLMDIANQQGGLVIGTGDLSELALGWATYNGDHMSMYGVNASVPKTLVRYLTAFEAERAPEGLREILLDVLGTPVSALLRNMKKSVKRQKNWLDRMSCMTFSYIICCGLAIRRARYTALPCVHLKGCMTRLLSKNGWLPLSSGFFSSSSSVPVCRTVQRSVRLRCLLVGIGVCLPMRSVKYGCVKQKI